MESSTSNTTSNPTISSATKRKTAKNVCERNEPKKSSKSQAFQLRNWFTGLSGEEKAFALSIRDSALISILIKLGEDAATPIGSNSPPMDIMKQVKLRDLDVVLYSTKKSSSIDTNTYNLMASGRNSSKCISSLGDEEPDKLKLPSLQKSTGSDENIHNAIDLIKQITPPEEIISTAFRIQHESNNDDGGDRSSQENANNDTQVVNDQSSSDTSIQTTLHFKSGLSLPISTKSESDKKVAQNAGRVDPTKSKAPSTNLPCTSRASTEEVKKSDEVHQHVSFGALRVPPKSKNLSDETKRKNAQRISDAKQSAARAMLASSSHASNVRLQKNLRFAFPSARNFGDYKFRSQRTSDSQKSLDEESIVLTIDPSYLSEQSGMQFLNDVQNIIDSELRKINSSSTKCKYLCDDFRIQEGNGVDHTNLPSLLSPYIKRLDSEVPLVLILLARIEQSINQSFKQEERAKTSVTSAPSYLDSKVNVKGEEKDSSKKTAISSPVQANIVPKPLNDKSNVEDLKAQGKLGSDVVVSHCLKSTSVKSDQSFLLDIFKAYKKLKKENELATAITVPSISTISLSKQDFLLVPVEKALSVPVVKSAHGTDHENMKKFISKWNSIIDSAHQIVHSAESNVKDENSLSNLDHEVVKLFADEVLTNKKTKKKKKKRKKRKGGNKKKNVNKSQSDPQVEKSKEEDLDSTKFLDSRANKVITESIPDCSASAVSKSSIASGSSQKNEIVDSPAEEKTIKDESPNQNQSNVNVDQVSENANIRNGKSHEGDNNDGWETVEPKGRGKKSSSTKSNNEKCGQISSQNSGRKNKNKSRMRNRNRQKDKEQAKANLDSHEVDIAKRGANTTKALMEERNKRQGISTNKKKLISSSGHGADTKATKRSGTKGTILGSLSSATTRFQSEETLKIGSVSRKNKVTDLNLNTEKSESIQRKKPFVADQNTASTVQETVSATSRSFAFADETSKRLGAKAIHRKSANDVATNATEARENSSGSSTLDRSMTPIARKNSAPPLQTLVGPGNFNSANSSVASSLDAPRATRHGSNKHTFSKEDDVGYHLLKVCERLSGDMNTFMARRALALSTRRRERGSLLSSLQETVQNIWVGQCHVEMYGSCATQLDLPSSDLDVVICGLDGTDDQRDRTLSLDDISESASHSPSSLSMEAQAYASQFYPPLTANGTRVIRLATELEMIPWAVQVKAIPTASVPVIKILADPSRLPGAAGMDWMLHHQQITAATVAAAEMNLGKMVPPQQSSENCDHFSPQCNEGFAGNHAGHINHHIAAMSGLSPNPSPYHSAHQPWRGADVMNGLLSLDITFQGTEHGGLGSTAFSAKVVQDACNETGLPPESTPVVQVLMIIKEMLAQRRLNEPFSGGLSSYAILLLVAAVVKERRIIRKEIERVEKQRQAVERTAVDDEVTDDSRYHQESKKVIWPAEKHSKKFNKVSSWASIAMKFSSNNTQDNSEIGFDDGTCSSKVTNETSPINQKADVASKVKPTQNQSQAETLQDSTLFPQGSNDVLEVLCSGEPTAGKLLMHFLLFYGRHFDANTTCIDVSGTHNPNLKIKGQSKIKSNSECSPFTPRKAGGTYNPVTDVYTVDPLIVYDPLEGAESNNVARSCYAWGNIRWTFEQCYNTLSGVVELGAGSNSNRGRSKTWPMQENVGLPFDSADTSRHVDDLSQQLLELLLSF